MPHLLRIRLALAACLIPAPAVAQEVPARHAGAIRALDAFIDREVAAKKLPALSIAVVDGPSIAWAKGYGFADREGKVPATADTIYRVGSVSKLFTDLAVMGLADEGKIDIDVPVTTYLPDFRPKNPSGIPITLRMMMAHRSGLGRETPVGSYFDPTEPTLADSVASLNRTELIHPPGTRTKYSNAAVAAVGLALEKVAGEPFAKAVEHRVLAPLGMTRSRFGAEPALDKDRASGTMWTYFGREFPAPTFELGTAPAGCMQSSVHDLGRFLVALMDDAQVPIAGLPKPATLAAMLTPQFAPPGTPEGFGLGFVLSRLQGHPRVGHNGAIYGFATELAALPDAKLGVVVVASKDFANGVTARVADVALGLLLASKEGRALPPIASTTPLDPGVAESLEGHYTSGSSSFDLMADGRTLRMLPSRGGFRVELRAQGADLMGDDLARFGPKLVRDGDALRLGDATYRRRAVPLPPPPGGPAPSPAGRPVPRPDRRIRLGPRHLLRPRTRRPAQRPDRMVRTLHAHRRRPGHVYVSWWQPVRWRDAPLPTRPHGQGHRSRGRVGRVPASPDRRRGRPHLPHQADPAGRRHPPRQRRPG